ncbi:carboxypeptidase regulatory-like domain-containing protein [Fervidibacter sacchari]|uniref:Plastocyanin n=1 Tax=Candidatus Fervidibacter sacchari TaxID=1448929 RepID=A0ABT2EK91_9BACT|nr:carboxypeptidase regulatory-like domain-containing protein [Candidatus Fervidibacter sacchari]MCS3918367.1 plastocyanin [Candidatus Fervidibacter sacchari]WKU16155.1 carboxypeptidase regulatory-like domain-containing protein [Candidatus Fervidibacter sacchari]
MVRFVLFCVAFALAIKLCAQDSAAKRLRKVSTAQGTGTIKGVVRFEGTPLKPRLIRMTQDRNCEAIHKGKPVASEEFVLNKNGTLKWVLVYVKSEVKVDFEPPSKPAVLDQQGCVYRPRVIGIMVGQPLEIHNSDPLFHNVHFVSKRNGQFNFSQPRKGMKSVRVFKNPELPGTAYFKCDIHPWMRAWVGIFDHPFFAVTGDDGSFTISGLPEGTYEIEAWHEKLGTKSVKVSVKSGTTVTVNFVFKR